MRNIWTILILSYLIFDLCCAGAMADGGRVVFMGQQHGYKICVFASPDPLRTGPVDLSVLIQDAKTGTSVTNSSVSVDMTPSDGRGPIIHAIATNAAATNKLLSAAL